MRYFSAKEIQSIPFQSKKQHMPSSGTRILYGPFIYSFI